MTASQARELEKLAYSIPKIARTDRGGVGRVGSDSRSGLAVFYVWPPKRTRNMFKVVIVVGTINLFYCGKCLPISDQCHVSNPPIVSSGQKCSITPAIFNPPKSVGSSKHRTANQFHVNTQTTKFVHLPSHSCEVAQPSPWVLFA